MDRPQLKTIIEAALLVAGEPLGVDKLIGVFPEEQAPDKAAVLEALEAIRADCAQRCLELAEVGSGYRLQVRAELAPWVSRLWEERPARYSRALLETLALIAYRQPITRAEIEDIRGVSVSSNIIKTLQEREWIRVVGHRDVPGKPAMYATTRQFLDYFNLKSLDELPPLAELRDIDGIEGELMFGEQVEAASGGEELPELDVALAQDSSHAWADRESTTADEGADHAPAIEGEARDDATEPGRAVPAEADAGATAGAAAKGADDAPVGETREASVDPGSEAAAEDMDAAEPVPSPGEGAAGDAGRESDEDEDKHEDGASGAPRLTG